jgi:hypothetical protein
MKEKDRRRRVRKTLGVPRMAPRDMTTTPLARTRTCATVRFYDAKFCRIFERMTANNARVATGRVRAMPRNAVIARF